MNSGRQFGFAELSTACFIFNFHITKKKPSVKAKQKSSKSTYCYQRKGLYNHYYVKYTNMYSKNYKTQNLAKIHRICGIKPQYNPESKFKLSAVQNVVI